MRYLWQHIEHIVSVYDGKLPLHHFLKNHFKSSPKLGSRDRRAISQAVYSWYRAGHALSADTTQPLQIKLLAAMYLCGGAPKILTGAGHEHYQIYPGSPAGAADELNKAGITVAPASIFPHDIPFSEGIDKGEWRAGMLAQPRLFVRIREKPTSVRTILEKAGIEHEWISETCLAFPNGTKLEGLLPDKTYVVQDASSQATGAFLYGKPDEHWWDCCAGAGGKSLMLADYSSGIHHLATDVRESILQNLAARFRQYHLPLPTRKVLDAADKTVLASALGSRRFEGIICDVPCSGSGTWARTPESCYFFQPETLEHYTGRQYAILSNAVPYCAPAGRIVYITCSVFKAENEAIVERVAAEKKLLIETSRLVNGISIGADSLYVAVLRPA